MGHSDRLQATPRTDALRARPSARLVRLAVGALLLATATACSTTDGHESASAATPSPTHDVSEARDADARGAECAPAASSRAEGPTASVVVAQEGTGTSPRVEMVRYPRPDGEGDPWSHWGQGLVLEDGRFLSAMGNHLGADGNSFLFVYEPSTAAITRFADIRAEIGGPTTWGFGKVHGQIVAGDCGDAYVSTYWGTRRGLAYSPSYQGDVLLRVDGSSLDVEPLGVGVPEHGVPSLAGSADLGLLYGEAVDPETSEAAGTDRGAFFVFDTDRREVVFQSDDADHVAFRNVMVDASGTAYAAASQGRLLVYEPGASQLREHGERLPGGGKLRASTAPTRDGTLFGATTSPAQLFAMTPDGAITSLGAAQGYTTSMAAEPDGSRVYYVPGAHGGAPELGAPVVAVDTRSGEQTTLVRLDDLAPDAVGLHAAGSYSVVLDDANRRLFVMLNAGPSTEDRWGEVVLAVVELPDGDGGPVTAADATSSQACPVPSGGGLATGYQAPAVGVSRPIDFDDTTDEWGVRDALLGVRGHAVATADVNDDGWTDVFVGTFADRPDDTYRFRGAGGPAPDRLLLGGPDGFLLDPAFPEQYGRTSGAAFADLDDDGDADLVVARNVRDSDRGRAPTTVLRNDDGQFRPVTTLSHPDGARSVGVLDYDADGRLDLFIAEDRFSGGSSVLLRNTGSWTFVDVTDEAGIGDDVAGMGVGTADLNGDGEPDLVVGGSNRVFLTEGGGRFEEKLQAIAPWAVFGDEDDAAGVAQADVNRDGRVDIVIGQHYNSTLDADQSVPVRLYLNEADDDNGIILRDATEAAGLVGLPTKSPHVDIVDVDADGWPDIVTTASGDDGKPIVFTNLGQAGPNPRFQASAKPGPRQYWVTGAALDADHDGRLDLMSVEWEPALPTLALRNVGSTGHWLAVTAAHGTVIEVFEAGRLGHDSHRIATMRAGVSTGYGAGPSAQVWAGLGDTRSVDVSVAPARLPPVELRGVSADRLLACTG